MLCIQANWLVPVSSSAATSGPPQNSPASTGVPTVRMTRKPTARLPRNSPPWLPQLWVAVHAMSADCHCEAICRPVTSSRTANTASTAAAR